MSFLRSTILGTAAASMTLALATASRAGGLFVPGEGPSTQGRAGAFAARADDPMALIHNPAGFAKQDGTQLYIGSNFVRFSLAYQRAGNYELSGEDDAGAYEGLPYPKVENSHDVGFGLLGFQAIPYLALSTDLNHPDWPVRFGAGLYSPQGYPSRDLPATVILENGVEAPAPQRYDSINQNVFAVQPSLAVAYSVSGELDVGLRLGWGIARASGLKSTWTIRNYEEYPGRDAIAGLKNAKDNFVPGFSVGALYRPSTNWELGAAYNSAGNINAQGTMSSETGGPLLGTEVGAVPLPDEYARCAKGGREGALKACLSAKIPQTAVLGARWIGRDARGEEQSDVELDVRWEDFSSVSDTNIQVDAMDSQTGRPLQGALARHGYRDAVSFRLGASHQLALPSSRLTMRAGAAYDTAAAPDSWMRVDQDGKERLTGTLGLALEVANYRFDVGGGAVWEPTIDVAQCNPPDGPTVDQPGCTGDTMTPFDDRRAPDPTQPLSGQRNQTESPFNAGRYESGYWLFSLGMLVRF